MTVLPEKSIDELNIDEYDSLLLPGAMDIREAVEDNAILDFIRKFDGMPIGAISIAPLLLLKAGLLVDKPFMAGVNSEGYIQSGNIVTWVSCHFV